MWPRCSARQPGNRELLGSGVRLTLSGGRALTAHLGVARALDREGVGDATLEQPAHALVGEIRLLGVRERGEERLARLRGLPRAALLQAVVAGDDQLAESIAVLLGHME